MCLDIKSSTRRQVADKDVVVYKLLITKYYVNNGLVYFTPYQNTRIEIGRTYQSRLCRNIYNNNRVDYGIHSFTSFSEAKRLVSKYYAKYEDSVVVRCIIPSGSYYYVGKFDVYNSIASNVLRYDKVLKRYSSN